MLQALMVQSIQNKIIDGIACPIFLAHARNRRPLRRNQRPVALPRRSLSDPAANQINLAAGQLFTAHVGRRHANRGIVGSHTTIDLAFLRIAGAMAWRPLPRSILAPPSTSKRNLVLRFPASGPWQV